MDTKTLQVPPENLGRLIGQKGRNIKLINKIIAPGCIVVHDDVVTIRGNLEDKQWCNKAIRVVRSAHRGGIIKWFSSWECDKFGKTPDQEWLEKIRKAQTRTDCYIAQHHVSINGEIQEAWIVLEDKKTSDLEKAIEDIGKMIHRRYAIRRNREDNYKSRYKMHITNKYIK
jgi:predicted RNA-binding protein YlqC (UPF0109 family)